MYMTLGVDVSSLFADMCLLSQFDSLLSKKMIYLYLTTQAENNPKLALLVVNTFVKNLNHKDEKIRGLALRSLCSLRSQYNQTRKQIVEKLDDSDYYVQKIAVMGCLKIFQEDINFFQQFNLYEKFYEMLKSPDSEVIIAIINVLNEVYEEEDGMPINSKIITYLLNKFTDFSDYGKSVVVELAGKYEPKDEDEKIKIMNILDSKFKSTDSNLVISLVKLFLKYNINNKELFNQVLDRVKDSLLTLLITADSEMQYCLLCHILQIVELGGKQFFENDYKRFFCSGKDKQYNYDLKLQILEKLTTEESFDDIFNELSHYVNSQSLDLSKIAMKILSNLGNKFQDRSESIIKLYMSILTNNRSDLFEQIFISLKQLLLNNNTSNIKFIQQLADLHQDIKSEESRESFLWILGKFGKQISDSSYILYAFIQDFLQKEWKKQSLLIQLINTTIKLFFVKPKENLPNLQNLFVFLLDQDVQNPYIVSKCQNILFLMKNDIDKLEQFILYKENNLNFVESNEIVSNFSYLNNFSAIYKQPEDKFLKSKKYFINQRKQEIQLPQKEEVIEEKSENSDNSDNSDDSDDSDDSVESYKQDDKDNYKINKQEQKQEQEQQDVDFLDFDNTQDTNLNDLGIQDIDLDFEIKEQQFSLQEFTMNPKDFQTNWINLKEKDKKELTLDVEIESKDEIIKLMENNKINCIASQQKENLIKFYFYCQSNTSQTILIEMQIEDQDEVILTMKSKDSSLFNKIEQHITSIFKKNNYLE